jgi:hypothetical protein
METNTKKIMKTLALVLALATAATTEGMAQMKATSTEVSTSDKVSNLGVQDMGNFRFKLTFENPLRQKTQIYLYDKDKNILFNEHSIVNAQYIRAFNLSNLADGEYVFVIETGKEKLTKEFVISTQTLRGISLASNHK